MATDVDVNLSGGLRRSPVAIALLTFAGLALLYIALAIGWQAQLPSDGVLLAELSPSGISVATLLVPMSNLQVGDRILDIDGFSVDELLERALAGETAPGIDWRSGATVQYRVQRAGSVLTVPVTLRPLHLGRLLLVRWSVYLLLALSLGVGLYVLLARPGDPSARLVFVASAALLLPMGLHFQTAVLLTPALFWADNVLKLLGRGLVFSSFLHLFMIFPVLKGLLRGRRWVVYGLHLATPLLALLLALLLGATPSGRLVVAWQVVSWISLLMLVASVSSLVHTYVTVRQAAERSQVRWVMWGSIFGLLPYIGLTALPEVIVGRPLLTIEWSSLFVAVLPAAIAIAVARYRLFDVDIVVHRAIVYVFFTLLLAGVYGLLVAGLGLLFVGPKGAENDTLAIVAALAVSTAFWALRGRVVGLANRILYRRRFDPHALQVEMSERLSGATHLDDVAHLLTHTVPELVGTDEGVLMVLSQDQARLEPLDGTASSILLQDVLDVWADRRGVAVLRSDPPPWFPPAARQVMIEEGLELAMPLVVGMQVVGLWGLGMRRSGLAFSSEEITALRTLSHQAAIAVQNARLVRHLETYSQQLKEEVQLHTFTLERERDRLNVILQNMANGLLVTDIGGMVLLTNPAFEEVMHKPRRELIGLPLERALNCPALSTLVIQALVRQGQVVSDDFDFADRVLRASASALRDGSGVVVVLRDITHEVEVDRIKSEFISTVSHELRTPLTSVLGFAKLIGKAFSKDVAPAIPADDGRALRSARRISDNLEIIINEGERLTRLINDVLDIAKMEAGKVEWHDQWVALEAIVEQTVHALAGQIKEKQLDVVMRVPSGLPPLSVDPDRLQQVMTNLLSNAVKFTERGHIVIGAQLLPAGAQLRGGSLANPKAPSVLVSVQDSGIGIAEEDLPRLFLRFQQLGGDTLTNKPKGTGLGLTICREIITHYGGLIWAESVLGEGTVFYFALPLAPEQAGVVVVESRPDWAPAEFARLADGNQRSLILIADDEPYICRLLDQALAEAGYRTLTVSSGADAVAQARRQRPDLILLDVMMPGISGLDVLQILKSDPNTRHIPVLVVSIVENRQQALALGADGLLPKPVEIPQLLTSVAVLLAQSGKLDEG